MRKLLFLIVFFFPLIIGQSKTVLTGIDVLQKNNFNILKGKRIGLITNQTGVDKNLKSTIDILFETKVCSLAALFGPEHGVRGDFSGGDSVGNMIDKKTNLPVYSLYGKTRKPTKAMLSNIDALVFDIQDIGCRSYTFISTMGLALESAAENNIEFIVLDRPNPLGGLKVEGNLVEDEFYSFVSQFKIPYVYGLTVGELAKYLNENNFSNDSISKKNKCRLKIVPMKNWKRNMTFDKTGLNWILTSPHIPYKESPMFYVATGILGELGVISEGVGYTIPFQTFAAEWIDANKISARMNELHLDGVIFRPIVFKPYYTKYKNKELQGVQIHITNYLKINLISLQFFFLQEHNKLYPEKNPFLLCDSSRIKMFDKVCGTSKIRELFQKRMMYEDIKMYLDKDVKEFKKVSKKYYLY